MREKSRPHGSVAISSGGVTRDAADGAPRQARGRPRSTNRLRRLRSPYGPAEGPHGRPEQALQHIAITWRASE